MENVDAKKIVELATNSMTRQQVSKIFRPVKEGDYSGMVEKVFADHSAKPKRGYRTGEMYRPLAEDDGPPTEDEEDIVVYDPANFEPHQYRRVTGLENCFFPKPIETPPLESQSRDGAKEK